jgi:hypothetical protein
MKPRERHIGFELDTAGSHHLHWGGVADRVFQEGGFTHTGLAANDDARASSELRRGQNLIDNL